MGLLSIFKDEDSGSKSRFDNETEISKFEVPEGITVLDSNILPNCEIVEIVLPSSLKAIDIDEGDVFERRKLLRHVDFSKVTMLKEIPECCFQDCKSLESILIPEGVETLGGFAFEGCNNLREIFLPKSLKNVSVLNPSSKCDVYLFSDKIDEDGLYEMTAEGVNNLFVLPETFDMYKEMTKELGLEVNLHIMPNEYLAPMPAPNYDAGPISFMVSVNGQEAGPFTIAQLQQFVATGEFTPQVYVWTDGMPQWELAGNVPELASLFSY